MSSIPEEESILPKVEYSSRDILKIEKKHLRMFVDKRGPDMFYKWKVETEGEGEDKEVKYTKQSFRPAILSTVFQVLYHPKTMIDRLGFGETWYYDESICVYKPGAKDFLAMVTKKIWEDEYKKSVVEPTFYDVKSSTGILREKFTLEPKYIPQKDNILVVYRDTDKKWKVKTIPNTPHLYVTSRYQTNYDPNAKNPLFDNFLSDVFNFEDIPPLQEHCGSILWFESFSVAFVLVGPTKGGKTEFTMIMCEVLGKENHKAVSIQSIDDTYERYRLYKLPVSILNEFSSVTIKDSARVKAVITGAPISARTLHSESIDFVPYVKFLITTNTLPHVYDDNESWWNKWQTIVVNKQKYDSNNPVKKDHYHKILTNTQEKRDAIFTWMVDGLLRLKNQNGNYTNRQTPEQVKKIWDSQQDTLGSFIYVRNGWIKITDTHNTPKIDVLNHYKEYCRTMGLSALSDQAFYKQMKRRYIDSEKPIFRDVKPEIDGKQVSCYGNLELSVIIDEPPEVER